MIKVSVVVPVYNVEKFLRECIDSLLNQTVPAHEIILVDDGSKDSSGQICDEYAEKYDLVKVIHKQNAGLGMARNTGLEHVTGDFVMFVDSDDYCSNDVVEQMAAVQAKTGCDTCKSGFHRVDLEGNWLSTTRLNEEIVLDDAVRETFLPRIIGSAPEKKDSVPPSAWSVLYSMKVIRDNDLWFVSEREWISEDTIFNIHYYNYARSVAVTDYVGYNYRTNPRSLTTTYRPDRFEKCLALYFKEIEILKEMDLYEICKYRLIRQFYVFLQLCFDNLKTSKLPGKEVRQELERMCGNEHLQTMIKQYPVHKMGIKQQVFVYLVKYRLIGILYMLYKN